MQLLSVEPSMPLELVNFTGTLSRAEAFVRAKAAHFRTDDLSVHVKYTKAKGRDVTGYYRLNDRRIVLAVKKRLRYPRNAAYGVGSQTLERPSKGRAPYKLLWWEDRFDSPEDLLVFVAGHEIWHFLCHSGQRKGDFETRANCHGFLWLAEFRSWTGVGEQVLPCPDRPLRPDRLAPNDWVASQRVEPPRQLELFAPDVHADGRYQSNMG
ncbi:MAG: hypothetical protein ACI8TX_002240 [Hyphomicrobiaceae bacterium]|jgi:hypothetical protein